MTLRWSKISLYYGLIYASFVTLIFELTDLEFTLPWEPISVIDIAVAFYLGFKNNSSYDRTWEARKIWGEIVNDNRTFATAKLTLLNESSGTDNTQLKKELIRRHLAWLIALKYVLRQKRTWEHNEDPAKLVFAPSFCEEYNVRPGCRNPTIHCGKRICFL